MATRSRQRPSDRSDSDLYEDDEFGLVTEADIDAYLADQELEDETETESKNSGFLNLQTASGLGLVGLGALYSLQQLGLPFGLDLGGAVTTFTILASILIMLTGFGVLSWSPAARRRRKARERAARLQRQARKTMGRQRDGRREDATAATVAALGTAGKAIFEAGRHATRAAEVAFAEQQAARRKQGKTRREASSRLTKDRRNRKIAGVAAGIANYTGLDPLWVRIAFVALAVMTNGIAIPLYFILSWVLPDEPKADRFEDDDDPFVRVSRD